MNVFNNFYIDNQTKLRSYNATLNEYKKYKLKYGDALFTMASVKKQICVSSIFLLDKKSNI